MDIKVFTKINYSSTDVSCVLTLHVHSRGFVHKVHEELGRVDKDLIPAVTDGAVPPCTLKTQRHTQHRYLTPICKSIRVSDVSEIRC